MRVTVVKSNDDMGRFKQERFGFSPVVLVKVNKMAITKMSVASDQGLFGK